MGRVGVDVILLPLLGGYLLIRSWNRTRFRVRRYEGYRLFLNAAVAGIVLFGFVFTLTRLWIYGLPWIDAPSCISENPLVNALASFPETWKSIVPYRYSGTTLGAFFLGWVLGALLNSFTDKVRSGEGWWAEKTQSFGGWVEWLLGAPDRSFREKAAEDMSEAEQNAQDGVQKDVKRIVHSDGNAFEIMLAHAIGEWKPIAVTLRSGKVYIGFVTDSLNPAFERKHVKILVTAQGYQEPKTKRFIAVRSYRDHIKDIEESDDDLSSLQLVFPVDEVVEISPFNENLYFLPAAQLTEESAQPGEEQESTSMVQVLLEPLGRAIRWW